ncbi:MAG: hypothetical protein ACREGF_02920 [Candidatus Saccharimonadales bacterium]
MARSHNTAHFSTVARAYREQQVKPPEAYRLLAGGGLDGRALAAEIAVEQAYLAGKESSDEAIKWIGRSSEMYSSVIAECQWTRPNWLSPTEARARLQLIQLPNHAAIAVNQTLPSPAMADKAYRQSVALAQDFQQSYFNNREMMTKDQATDTVGAGAELAVLLLGQRLAVYSIGCENWMIMPSLYSQDRANQAGSVHNQAWDLSGYDGSSGVNLQNRIQVKSTNYENGNHSNYAANISLVHVSPDLSLPGEEHTPPVWIIADCYRELCEPNPIAPSDRLMRRTNLLLGRLDQAAA